LSLRCINQPHNGALTVELNNAGGKFSGNMGSEELFEIGWQLEFSPGYITGGEGVNSPGMVFWLESYEYVCADGKATLELHGIDTWGLLGNWQAHQPFRWNKESYQVSVVGILAFIMGRVGIKLVIQSISSTATGFYPDFTLHPGDSGTTAVEKLLSFIPDRLLIEGEVAYLINLKSEDAPIYEYGNQHVIFESRFGHAALQTNSVRVDGDGISIEYMNWPQLDQFPDRHLAISDMNIGSLEQAETRGQSVLRKAELEAFSGYLRVPVNCGQQLNDVVMITERKAGLSGEKRRVQAIELNYIPQRAIYEQKILLGGV